MCRHVGHHRSELETRIVALTVTASRSSPASMLVVHNETDRHDRMVAWRSVRRAFDQLYGVGPDQRTKTVMSSTRFPRRRTSSIDFATRRHPRYSLITLPLRISTQLAQLRE